MPAVGPASFPSTSCSRDLPTNSNGFTIGASDTNVNTIFNATYARRLIANAAGNVAVKLVGDTAFVVYALLQGQFIEGRIQVVGGTGSGSSAIAIVLQG